MPELPEVETIKNTVREFLLNAQIRDVVVRQYHFREDIPQDFVAHLVGATIINLRRVAKYLLIDLDNGNTIIWHFGMSGKFKMADGNYADFAKHDHIVLETNRGKLIYNDTRRFGLVTYCKTKDLKQHHLLKDLGLDPWDAQLTEQYLLEKFAHKKTCIKSALLDQSIICGIGNIYASEILYKARIHPQRSAESVTFAEAHLIICHTKDILAQAIKAGGSTIHDYKRPNGEGGHFQDNLCVYGKEGKQCPDCSCFGKNKIQKIVMGGRSTFFCAHLQK